MDKLITLYHGSEVIVEVPEFGKGRKNNDYGLGFYCTESEDLAKEWAVSSLNNGFVNRYTLDTEYLNILDLNSSIVCLFSLPDIPETRNHSFQAFYLFPNVIFPNSQNCSEIFQELLT